MARDGVAVSPELAALVARAAAGEVFNIRAECVRVGVSTKTFYKYLSRFRTEGVDGFYPRSRRPVSSPTKTAVDVEDWVVRARKVLTDEGWDAGADQIRYWLEDHDVDQECTWPRGQPLPSRTTINRVIQHRGLVVPVPQRRPKAANRRFEAERPNSRWQLDGLGVDLVPGKAATVLHLVDDCSRQDMALRAVPTENGADAWDTFLAAAEEYGLPAELLTDNGPAFSGRRRGWTSALEENLAALGVRHVTSSIAHPQTCGKCERAHKTLRQWLAKQRAPATLEELQTLLDRYREHYNNNRRKAHLGGLTPAQRYTLGPLDGPTDPLTTPPVFTTVQVSASGCIGISGHLISIGRRHAGNSLLLIRQDKNVTAFHGNQLIAQITLTRGRRYLGRDAVVLPMS